MEQGGQEFDFDHWSGLAKRDPAAFFALRQRIIEDFIAAAPARHREHLREMQQLIDATRLEAGTPMQAVRRMMGMLGDHLEALQGQFVELRKEADELSAAADRMRL